MKFKASERGFSLVEVTIAMAIAAVAIVTLLGLIPQGMDTMREAGDQAIMGRIQQQILNELQLTPFEDKQGNDLLSKYNGLEVFYDSQGEELGDTNNNASKEGSFEHIYSARITISEEGNGRAPASVGGAKYEGFTFTGNGSGSDEMNPYVRPVVIEVAAVAGLAKGFDWDDEENRSLIATFRTLLVKTGQNFIP